VQTITQWMAGGGNQLRRLRDVCTKVSMLSEGTRRLLARHHDDRAKNWMLLDASIVSGKRGWARAKREQLRPEQVMRGFHTLCSCGPKVRPRRDRQRCQYSTALSPSCGRQIPRLRNTVGSLPVEVTTTRLSGPRVLPGGRENEGSSLVGLGHGVVLYHHAAVLGLHGRVSVDAELRAMSGGEARPQEEFCQKNTKKCRGACDSSEPAYSTPGPQGTPA